MWTHEHCEHTYHIYLYIYIRIVRSSPTRAYMYINIYTYTYAHTYLHMHSCKVSLQFIMMQKSIYHGPTVMYSSSYTNLQSFTPVETPAPTSVCLHSSDVIYDGLLCLTMCNKDCSLSLHLCVTCVCMYIYITPCTGTSLDTRFN